MNECTSQEGGQSLISMSNSKGTSTQSAKWSVPWHWAAGDPWLGDGPPVTIAQVSQGKVLKKDLTMARNGRSQITINGGSLDPCHFQAIDSLSGQWQKNSRS